MKVSFFSVQLAIERPVDCSFLVQWTDKCDWKGSNTKEWCLYQNKAI